MEVKISHGASCVCTASARTHTSTHAPTRSELVLGSQAGMVVTGCYPLWQSTNLVQISERERDAAYESMQECMRPRVNTVKGQFDY